MEKKGLLARALYLTIALALLFSLGNSSPGSAQDTGPIMLDPNLEVSTVLTGLNTPTGLAFLDEDEMFILEKSTGQVQHVAGGSLQGAVLDLAVNFSSERGLLGITLDPDFDENGYVYLYWTCSAPPPTVEPYFPTQVECPDEPATGEDTDDVLAVPLLGNRVDRFTWDGSSLSWDLNLIKLRAFQHDGAPVPRNQGDEDQPALGNHDGGVITFGKDGKLYIIIGDVGRRGALQNLPFGPIDYAEGPGGPTDDSEALNSPSADQLDISAAQIGGVEGPAGVTFPEEDELPADQVFPDDQFGGPYPDDAHFTGVVLRLEKDGSIPTDNPFYQVGQNIGGEIGENLQMTYAYGIRNSFGMAVDPISGVVWTSENGEDAFDELNAIFPGHNSGWIQIQGPLSRVRQYKEIETTSLHNEAFPNLQQLRWPPENIADRSAEALRRLYWLPGSRYSSPEISWKYVIAPAAIGFVDGEELGDEYHGDLFMGLSVPLPVDGPLFRFELTSGRRDIVFDDENLDDMVADNADFFGLTESESFLAGAGFGVLTDIETGPNGNLYALSFSNGALYEISRRAEALAAFNASLSGEAEVPGPGDPDGFGTAKVIVDEVNNEICFALSVAEITLPAAAAHIHAGTADVAGPVVVPFTAPDEQGASAGCTSGVDAALIQDILANPGGYYVNVHTSDFPAGAVRGQLSEAGSGASDNLGGQQNIPSGAMFMPLLVNWP